MSEFSRCEFTEREEGKFMIKLIHDEVAVSETNYTMPQEEKERDQRATEWDLAIIKSARPLGFG